MSRSEDRSLTPTALLRVLVPVVGAALAVGLWKALPTLFAQNYLREGLFFLPFFSLRESIAQSMTTVLIGALPVAIAWFIASRLVRRSARLALIIVALALSGWLTVVFPGGSPLAWLLVVAVASVLSVLMAVGASSSPPHRPIWGITAAVFLSLALVYLVTGWRSRSVASKGKRNVVLIVLDTVGARHMAAYGYDRVTTPEIDRLAAEGMIFKNSFATAPWTLPSHASLFTGLYPISHGATQENLRLEDSLVTVAELLKNRGYRTFGVTNNPVISAKSNFQQGFTTYLQMESNKRGARRPDTHPTEIKMGKFLDSLGAQDRFLVFLNFIEAHSPYQPRRESAERFLANGWDRRTMKWASRQNWDRHYMEESELSSEELAILSALYDAELADLSRTVQGIVDSIESRGLLDDTLIIVTSDHGENIGDHDHFGHVFDLHDSLLRVPLIFYGGGTPRSIERHDPVTTTDLFYTILALAGVERQVPVAQGRDLLAAAADEYQNLPLVAEYYYPSQVLSVLAERGKRYERRFAELAPYLRRLRSIRIDGWKLIWGTDGNHALYDLTNDPEESQDLATEEPERVRQLEHLLLAKLREMTGEPLEQIAEPYEGRSRPRGFEDFDEDTREQLRALGYLD